MDQTIHIPSVTRGESDPPYDLDLFQSNGFATIPQFFNFAFVDELREAIEVLESERLARSSDAAAGIRNLLSESQVLHAFAKSELVRRLVMPILGADCFAVRGILFDKTPETNWKVPWHQDLTIAVRDRQDEPGFGPWTTKAGVTHVQPPAAVLEKMVSVRVHIDPCGPKNGPLRVLPGSQDSGRLSPSQIRNLVAEDNVQSCVTGTGGVVLMRPLILHASSVSDSPAHRRVIHIDYAGDSLPGALEWHSRIGTEVGE